MASNKIIDGQIYLPSFLNASVIRDQNGRCWSRSGYIISDGEIELQDIELFNVESSAVCCEECISNIEEDYGDIEILYDPDIPDISDPPSESSEISESSEFTEGTDDSDEPEDSEDPEVFLLSFVMILVKKKNIL